MSRCRLHVFLPDEVDQEHRRELEAAFDDRFASSDATVQENTEESVSEPFEETDENLERVEAFEQRCREIHPEADILRTRQHRDAMDGLADEHDYEVAIMLTLTHSLV